MHTQLRVEIPSAPSRSALLLSQPLRRATSLFLIHRCIDPRWLFPAKILHRPSPDHRLPFGSVTERIERSIVCGGNHP